jgi:hypothetical protein
MALVAAPAAFEMPDSAVDETFERPCEAWVVALEAALETALAASVVVEAWRTAMRPIWGVRRSIREAEKDMMKTMRSDKGTTNGEKGREGAWSARSNCSGRARCQRLQIYKYPAVLAPGTILSVRLRAALLSFVFSSTSTSPPSTLSLLRISQSGFSRRLASIDHFPYVLFRRHIDARLSRIACTFALDFVSDPILSAFLIIDKKSKNMISHFVLDWRRAYTYICLSV